MSPIAMKILHVSDYFDPGRIGGSTRLIGAHLERLSARGHEMGLLAGHPKEAPREFARGIPWFAFRYPPDGKGGPFRSLKGIRRGWDLASRSGAPEIVVFHQPLSANAILDLVAQSGAAIIYSLHSPWSREHLASWKGPVASIGAGFRKSMERRVISRALRVVTESRYMRDEARRLHSIPEDRCVVIPGGVDLERFRPAQDRDALRLRLEVPPGILVFTLRRLVPRMGIDSLIRAVGGLPGSPRPVHLWIGGSGPEADRLGRLAKASGAGRVRLLGPVGDEDLPDLYAAADLFVLPTRELEGFGLAAVEALASGTPALVTPVGASPEVITDLDPDLVLGGSDVDAIGKGLREAQQGRWLEPDFRDRCHKYAAERYDWSRAVDLAEALAREAARLAAPA